MVEKLYNNILNENTEIIKHNEKIWDYIVFTVANNEQEKIYKIELNKKIEKRELPSSCEYLIVPDNKGKKIGSGGALINVIKTITEKEGSNNWINDKKILLINAGGEASRVLEYSILGKLFLPSFRKLENGKNADLIDDIIASCSIIGKKISQGILITTADIVLVFDKKKIIENIEESSVITVKETAIKGENHGVFISNANTNTLEKFFQKESIIKLKTNNAIDENGNVDIDTGIAYLNSKFVNNIYKLISNKNKINIKKYNKYVNKNVTLNFYIDFLYALSNKITLKQYLNVTSEDKVNNKIKYCRRRIWDILKNTELKVVKIRDGKFIHFGTNKELKELLITKNNPNYIENSIVKNSILKGNDMIFNSYINNLEIPANVIIQTLPLKGNKYVTLIYPIDGNIKEDNNFFKKKIYKLCNDKEESVKVALRTY